MSSYILLFLKATKYSKNVDLNCKILISISKFNINISKTAKIFMAAHKIRTCSRNLNFYKEHNISTLNNFV